MMVEGDHHSKLIHHLGSKKPSDRVSLNSFPPFHHSSECVPFQHAPILSKHLSPFSHIFVSLLFSFQLLSSHRFSLVLHLQKSPYQVRLALSMYHVITYLNLVLYFPHFIVNCFYKFRIKTHLFFITNYCNN